MGFLQSTRELNIIAPVNQLGYGVTGINFVKGINEAGHTPALTVLGHPDVPEDDVEIIQEAVNASKTPNWEAPCVRIWHQHDMSMFVGRGTKIGMPIFELDRFTDLERHHLSFPDKLFVCSDWAKQVILNNFPDREGNVEVVPLGVDTKLFRVNVSSRDETIFLNCGKWEVRKGHDILVEAFNQAFDESDKVELWMMCDNPFHNKEENFEWERLYKSSKLGTKIRMIPRQQTQKEVYEIMQQADCGVFPARAEGWNLELLEMMSCGKQVIATNYSGHTEFCNSENCNLIETSELEPAVDNKWFRGQGQWAKMDEEQIKQIADQMRKIHQSKKEDRLRINQDGIDTAKKYSWKNSSEILVDKAFE
jgi:glycosyltransferase involved in cell wall biosynthesis